jgi:hypothetical protein
MDSQRRRNAETDLKATAEDLAHDARRVAAIEGLKAELDADDPRTAELSKESERITEEMAAKAKMEIQLQRQAALEASN